MIGTAMPNHFIRICLMEWAYPYKMVVLRK